MSPCRNIYLFTICAERAFTFLCLVKDLAWSREVSGKAWSRNLGHIFLLLAYARTIMIHLKRERNVNSKFLVVTKGMSLFRGSPFPQTFWFFFRIKCISRRQYKLEIDTSSCRRGRVCHADYGISFSTRPYGRRVELTCIKSTNTRKHLQELFFSMFDAEASSHSRLRRTTLLPRCVIHVCLLIMRYSALMKVPMLVRTALVGVALTLGPLI